MPEQQRVQRLVINDKFNCTLDMVANGGRGVGGGGGGAWLTLPSTLLEEALCRSSSTTRSTASEASDGSSPARPISPSVPIESNRCRSLGFMTF